MSRSLRCMWAALLWTTFVKSDFIKLSTPKVCLNHIDFVPKLQLSSLYHNEAWPSQLQYQLDIGEIQVDRSEISTRTSDNQSLAEIPLNAIRFNSSGYYTIQVCVYTTKLEKLDCGSIVVHSMPGILSITPPLVTVVMAMVLKQVFIALIAGIWLGAFFVYRYNPLVALLRTFDTYFARVINYESGHAQVIVFCFLLGGLIGIVQKGGGAQGLGKFVTRFTTTRFRALLAVIGLNLLIFFDDYSAILIVGTTFKSIMNNLYISSAKFAFMIHGISACFVSIVPISSWVGVQIGYIEGQSELSTSDPFMWYMESIPYRFFPLLWIAFILIIVLTGKDFGVMLDIERKAYQRGLREHSSRLERGIEFSPMLKLGIKGDPEDRQRQSEPKSPIQTSTALSPNDGTPLDRWQNAALPFFVVAASTFIGLYLDGSYTYMALPNSHGTPTWVDIFANANSFNALMWGSLFGCITALIMLIYQKILTLNQAMDAWLAGIAENILFPIIILLLAWALGQVIVDISASQYLAKTIGTVLPVEYLPALVNILCFIMSFSTGTAFGSMGIMFPLVIPLAHHLGHGDVHVLQHCIGSILGGSLFGNIISPIADDTILASMSTSMSITDHVSSMIPYIALVSTVSILFGSLPVAFGWYGPYAALFMAISFLTGVVYTFGGSVDSNGSMELHPLL